MTSDSATAPWLQHHGTDTRAGRQQPRARWWGRASSCGHTLGSASLSSHHRHVQGWSAKMIFLHDIPAAPSFARAEVDVRQW